MCIRYRPPTGYTRPMRRLDPVTQVKGRVALEVHGERDQSDSYRHKWTTTLRFGLLRGVGVNLAEAAESLRMQLVDLAGSDAALDAMAREDLVDRTRFERDVATFGGETARKLFQWRIQMVRRFPPIFVDRWLAANRQTLIKMFAEPSP